MSEEEIEQRIRKELRVTGVINSDEQVLKGLDSSGESKSQVIPVEYKTDGTLSSRSSVMDQEQIRLLLDYSRKKAGELGRQIGEGEVSMNPCEVNQADACAYCAFKSICSFEEKIPGYEKRRLENEDEEILWDHIRNKLQNEEE